MKKNLSIVIFAMFIFGSCFGFEIEVNLKKTDKIVELKLENVKIKELSFTDGNKIEIESSKEEIFSRMDGDAIVIFSKNQDGPAKVEISLPVEKTYRYKMEDNDQWCEFDAKEIFVKEGDKLYVHFKDKKILIKNDDEDLEIEVEKDRIFVETEDETINMSKEGVFIEKNGKMEELTNFWGLMLCGAIQTATNFGIEKFDVETIAKAILNSNLNLGDFEKSERSDKNLY